MPKQCPYLCAVPKALHQKAPSNKPAVNSPCSRNPLSRETKLRSVTQKKD
ncbi:rCG34193 [Rattus norvegicus]|uniref:RCG34193 n=1 Tax=Rattus norvegicus TaxID=10116 RepID=A6HK77_RAT|nr:rCG34193 [Rattus norvegicus]